MSLIYLSPIPWNSFAQRPHKFVEWFHHRTGEAVLWIEPYPTRLPRWNDVREYRRTSTDYIHSSKPPWLTVIKPNALPIEPIPGADLLNMRRWQDVRIIADGFAANGNALVAVGKPSHLALILLRHFEGCPTLYDAMDDFPAFYRGISRLAMRKSELRIARLVDTVWTSSTELMQHWSGVRNDVKLVPNGLDPGKLLPRIAKRDRQQVIFGYLGTIADWFDWNLILVLSELRSQDEIRLIGPVFHRPTVPLPSNIKMLPACDHETGLAMMRDFDVGLIPFKNTKLTKSVDPIKYYEYRALDIPVISTDFGEMRFRHHDAGVFVVRDTENLAEVAAEAAAYCSPRKPIYRLRR